MASFSRTPRTLGTTPAFHTGLPKTMVMTRGADHSGHITQRSMEHSPVVGTSFGRTPRPASPGATPPASVKCGSNGSGKRGPGSDASSATSRRGTRGPFAPPSRLALPSSNATARARWAGDRKGPFAGGERPLRRPGGQTGRNLDCTTDMITPGRAAGTRLTDAAPASIKTYEAAPHQESQVLSSPPRRAISAGRNRGRSRDFWGLEHSPDFPSEERAGVTSGHLETRPHIRSGCGWNPAKHVDQVDVIIGSNSGHVGHHVPYRSLIRAQSENLLHHRAYNAHDDASSVRSLSTSTTADSQLFYHDAECPAGFKSHFLHIHEDVRKPCLRVFPGALSSDIFGAQANSSVYVRRPSADI